MQAVGVSIDGTIVRRAFLRLSGKNLVVESLQSLSLSKSPHAQTKTFPLVSGLSSGDLLIRTSSVPTSHQSHKVKEALKIQTQSQLHFQPDSLVSVVLLNQKNKRATIYSTTQQALSSHLEHLSKFHQNPDRISAIPEALKALVCWKEPRFLSYFLVDFGLSVTHCLWVEDGLVQKAYTLSFGVHDLSEPERAKLFRSELSRTFLSFQCIRPLVLTGEECDAYLAEALKSCTTEEKGISLSPDEQRFAVSIGLAIDYLVNRKDPVQFRKPSSLSQRNFFLIDRNALLLSLLSFCCCLTLLLLGTRSVHLREERLVQRLHLKVGKDPALRRELYSMGSDPHALVAQWSKMMKQYGREYPYLVRSPRVGEVLDWLQRHPFSLDRFHYQLLSFPRIEALKEPYLGKVTLEFRAATPMHARQWHEELLRGEGLCDPSKEISWEELADGYSVSFFLKNRNSDV